MGQTAGKQVERKTNKPLIWEKIKFGTDFEVNFNEDPMRFIETRLEMKEKIDQWAFKWSHLILEEVFVWPEYDIKELLRLIEHQDLGDLMPKSKI